MLPVPSHCPQHVKRRERRMSWWLWATSVGAPRFVPTDPLSSFSLLGRSLRPANITAVLARWARERSWWTVPVGSGPLSGGLVGLWTRRVPKAGWRGDTARARVPASRGTATPTGRAGTASRPSGRPWARGADGLGLGRLKESEPKAGPAGLGLACPGKGNLCF